MKLFKGTDFVIVEENSEAEQIWRGKGFAPKAAKADASPKTTAAKLDESEAAPGAAEIDADEIDSVIDDLAAQAPAAPASSKKSGKR